MNPAEIKAALNKIGAQPNKRLGQHFLIDRAALHAIVDAADLKRGETVLEIGPGLGVLTDRLLAHGAKVVAIEQDRMFVSYLKQAYPGLEVVRGNAATLGWQESIGGRPWKLVSNLPYSITSLALRKALWPIHRSTGGGGELRPANRVVVLIQREVAERAVGRSGKTSLLSLMVALASSAARIVRRVPAGAFYPPPKVESAILEIMPMPWPERTRRWGIDPEKIMALAKAGFAHPRKQLASNLASVQAARLSGKDVIASALTDIGLNPKARAEDLSPHSWSALAKRLADD